MTKLQILRIQNRELFKNPNELSFREFKKKIFLDSYVIQLRKKTCIMKNSLKYYALNALNS